MKNLMPFANWDSLKILSSFKWISTYAWQQTISRAHSSVPPHLILALADHFEPYILPHNLGVYASRTEQLRRVKAWCQQYPQASIPAATAMGIHFVILTSTRLNTTIRTLSACSRSTAVTGGEKSRFIYITG